MPKKRKRDPVAEAWAEVDREVARLAVIEDLRRQIVVTPLESGEILVEIGAKELVFTIRFDAVEKAARNVFHHI